MGWLSARDVLWYLTFCGFAINYMLRININIAIVGMARGRARQHSAAGTAPGQCGSGALAGGAANYSGAELFVLNYTAAAGIDVETQNTIQFNISSPTTLKSVQVSTSRLTTTVEATHSLTGSNFTVLSSTQVVSSSAVPKTSDTLDSADGATRWTVSTHDPPTRYSVNETGTAAVDFKDLTTTRSVENGTTPSALKTSSSSSSVSHTVSDAKTTIPKTVPSLPGVLDNVAKTTTTKTLSTLNQKELSSTVPATLSVTERQPTKDGSTQAPQWTSTSPSLMLPTAVALTAEQEDGRYDWDEYQQGLVLGAFFWLHWCTQIPGGMLAQRIGPKLVFGVSNLVACLLAVLLPLAASIDYRALIAVRVLQGFIAGAAWPSMHSMTANWIPPNDRSKFVTAYLGSSVGAALTFPLCGFLMEWFGWPTVFYSTALLGSAWFLAWWFLVFDHPHVHPRISRSELDYLKSNLGQTVAKRKPPTPWKEIVTSLPLWMNVVAQWGGIWGLFTMLTQAPTYFRHVHGWSIRATGLLSGFPHICRITFAMVVSWIGDYMLKKEKISRTKLRKIATALCTVVQGVFVLGLAYSGCSPVVAAACLAAAVGASGAVSTGPLASLVDISPNYASILMGITNMLTVMPGFISPIIVGLLTYQNQTADAWRVVFLITAAMLVVPGIVYALCASSELQPWNSPAPAGQHEMEAAPEKVPLKADVDENGSPPSKAYLQDDGNLLTKRDFQKDGNLLAKEDGKVLREPDSQEVTKRDIKVDGSMPSKQDSQEDGGASITPDGENEGGEKSEQDVNKSRLTGTKPKKETVGSFPISPYVGSDEGVLSKSDVEKDGDVPNMSDAEKDADVSSNSDPKGDDVTVEQGVKDEGCVADSQELERDRSGVTKLNIQEDSSVPTKLDVQGSDCETQRTDVEMGSPRRPADVS